MKYLVCGCNSGGPWGDDPYNKEPKLFNTFEEAKKYLEDVLSVADLNPEMDSGFDLKEFNSLTLYMSDDSCSVYEIFKLDV